MKSPFLTTILLYWSLVLLISGSTHQGIGTTISLHASHKVASPGQTIKLGFYVQHQQGFHTYWKNPGEVGYPLQINWQNPSIHFTEVEWAYPTIVDMSGIPAHGFHGDVIHTVECSIPLDYKKPALTIQAVVHWMACAENCHPQSADFHVTLDIGEKPTLSEYAPQLYSNKDSQGEAITANQASLEHKEDVYHIHLPSTLTSQLFPGGFLNNNRIKDLYFFSHDPALSASVTQQPSLAPTGEMRLTVKANPFIPIKESKSIDGLLRYTAPKGFIYHHMKLKFP